MAAADVLKKVLQLKRQLEESSESKTILKILKRLQELDITLDILAETGIGKAVNAFRKHGDVGEVAKTLVNQWKKLVPKESTSLAQEQSEDRCEKEEEEECLEVSEKKSGFDKNSAKLDTECKNYKYSLKKNMLPSREDGGGQNPDGKRSTSKGNSNKDESSKSFQPSVEVHRMSQISNVKSKPNTRRNVCELLNGQGGKSSPKDKSERVKPNALERHEKNPSGGTKMHCSEEKRLGTKKTKVLKISKKIHGSDEIQQSDDDFAKPVMSFESYLSYDVKAPKRKKKSHDKRTAKKSKDNPERTELSGKTTNGKTSTELSKRSLEEPPKKASTGSVMDLLNIPLPTFLPECEDLSSFPYFEKKAEDVVSAVCEEAPVFTGQRLNRKMQVYSGSKTTFLPTMMSLHQQCLRALQNNIDLLYEIGGVPFEIIEPVLERCTPKQLLRIEECNPVYIGETDHLWERHCRRDFRNGRLEEYESWREMHLRLSEERESKLKRLTESIVSAHSGKPKGRQVKLAFINSVAKPPRHVRIQQELHGTAGPVGQSNQLDRPSIKPSEGRARPSCSEATTSSSQAPDPKKMRRVAPMMAKSLKAFKKQLGRR